MLIESPVTVIGFADRFCCVYIRWIHIAVVAMAVLFSFLALHLLGHLPSRKGRKNQAMAEFDSCLS